MGDRAAEKSLRLNVKYKARDTLDSRGTRLTLIFGIIIVAAVYFAIESVEAAIYYSAVSIVPTLKRSELFVGILTGIFDLMPYFLISPFALGLYRTTAGAVYGEGADLRDLFYYFSPRRYFRSVLTYGLNIAPLHIYTLAVSAAYALLPLAFESLENSTVRAYLLWMAQTGLFFVALIVGFFVLWLYSRIYATVAAVVCGGDQPIFVCFSAALRVTKKRSFKILLFRFSFIPVFLLGVVSVGVIMLIFTVPYMLISYFHYNAELFGVDTDTARLTEVTFDER
jgi:uncharacterized membrane protein